LHFYIELMRQARAKIDNGTFDAFRKDFVSNYKVRDIDLAA
jgi:queuine/archaeosine tRNA-ribosyltransferase